MNRRKTPLVLWLLGGIMLAGATACSDDDEPTATTACSGDDEPTATTDDGVKVRRLTITQTNDTIVGHASGRANEGVDATLGGVANYATRASLTEDGGLSASWTAGDGLTYCNLSRVDYGNEDAIYTGPLTAASTAVTSHFTGDVTCCQGDCLAVVYPATTFTTNDSYTLSLTGQDGTLETLATNYHYVYGKATVTSVTDKTATATMPKMKSLLTVCKFSFIDRASSSAIPIKTLAISYGGTGSDAGTYPQTATVAVKNETIGIFEQADVHATGVTGSSPLLLEGSGKAPAVFVALLPTAAQRTYSFTVTDGSGNTYTGTAKATLTEGKYVEATGLKLTKQP